MSAADTGGPFSVRPVNHCSRCCPDSDSAVQLSEADITAIAERVISLSEGRSA